MYYLDYISYLYKKFPKLSNEEIQRMATVHFLKIFLVMMFVLLVALILEHLKMKYRAKKKRKAG